MDNLAYHLTELEIATNKKDARSSLPKLTKDDQVILDIGCGIGQSFIALNCLNRHCIGVDIDKEAIKYGKELFGQDIEFHLCNAENLPANNESLDLIICRVSLPYTNIPKVIKEIKRTLKSKGRVWFTLHNKTMAQRYIKEAWQPKSNWRRKLHVYYILLNGYLFKYFGIVIPYLNGRYESWQDEDRILCLLEKEGFKTEIKFEGKQKYFTATKLPLGK